ncbi:hypothetical protein IDH21_00575 [Pelagibacterales bacterium SAG-MED47]|nr:hypothetical protein [Pelagibacterales bacterium SAG-MED47]
MSKKTFIQIFLVIFLILTSYFVFIKYFDQSKTAVNSNLNNVKVNSEIENTNNKQDLIENVKYKSNNAKGDVYELIADYGESKLENPNLMFLTNVQGKILFKNENKSNIILTSKFARFNTVTFETTFIKDVKITRKNEVITGNELYLVLDHEEESSNITQSISKEKNLIRMSKNILFKKPGYSARADIFEIDLTTKNTKIYMNNNSNKVSVTGLIR